MRIVLPFTCKQLDIFGDYLAKFLKWLVLIGSPILLVYGIQLDSQTGVLYIIFGAFGTLMGWLIAIACWNDDGTISCKRVKKNDS